MTTNPIQIIIFILLSMSGTTRGRFIDSSIRHSLNVHSSATALQSKITNYPHIISFIRGGTSAGPDNTFSASTFWRPNPSSASKSYRTYNSQPRYTVQPPPDEDEEEELDHEHVPDTPNTKEQIQAFLTRDHRNTFIARVYSILSAQLIFTAAVVLAFGTNRYLQYWIFKKGQIVPILSVVLSSIAWFITCYNPTARRSPQMKWWLLGVFTLGEATVVGFLSSFYKFSVVISAMLSTALATAAITLYTLWNKNPKHDLSQWGSTLTSIGLIFLAYGILHLCSTFGLLPHDFLPYNETIMSFIGAVLFSAYLAYHTRLVVSGKHSKYQLNDQDYVFGAMTLYSDVINIFLYLLRLLGEDSLEDK